MDTASVFKALGDPVRLRIVGLVAEAGEICVCRIVERMAICQPAVSHHLAKLRQAGVLRARRRGQWIYYSLDPAVIESFALEPLRKMLQAASRQTEVESECCIDAC